MGESIGQRGRPRVLFLAHRIPYPPDKGDKIRSYHEMQALADATDLTVACFVDDPRDEAHLPALRERCPRLETVRLGRWGPRARALGALLTGRPLSIAWYRDAAMRRRITALPPFDAVLAFSSTTAPYALAARAKRRVLDLCDLDSEKWAQFADHARFPLSWVYASEARRLGAYERAMARTFDATVLVSAAERDQLLRDCPGAPVHVVPNGVDLDFFDPAAVNGEADPRTLVFCGAMDYRSNVDAVCWFHDAILPLVREAVPDVRFRIVGAKPAPEVQRLAATPGVEVTGRVEDVRPAVLGAAVSVAPMRLGRGVPNKVLEALALTLPVVVTPNAAAGLALGDFAGAAVEEGAEGFARAVVERLREGVRRHPGNRGILRQRYSWARHMEALRRLVLPA